MRQLTLALLFSATPLFALRSVAQDVTPLGQELPRRAQKPPFIDVEDVELTIRDQWTAVTGDGRFFAFLVDEGAQGGTDLNGDGDVGDRVLHFYEVRTGLVINQGLAAWGPFEANENAIHVKVDEENQGADLNGDGDTQDTVHFVIQPGVSSVQSPFSTYMKLGEQSPWAGIIGDEDFQGDLNGDGDTDDDLVLIVWNIDTDLLTPLDPPSAHLNVGFNGSSILLLSEEADEDLNGDGDTDDYALHTYLADLGQLYATGLTGLAFVRDGMEVFQESEQANNEDLNGDGDLDDRVLTMFHKPSFAIRSLPFALGTVSIPSEYDNGTIISIEGDRVAFSVPEFDQGGVDLNGNGVIAGAVLHLHDFGDDSTMNLGYAVWDHVIESGHVVFEVREQDQGFDLNNDGDQEDFVLHVHNIASGETTNLGLTTQTARRISFQVAGGQVAFNVSELAQSADLNGDGDLWDEVIHVYDLASGKLSTSGLATNRWPVLGTRSLFFQVEEEDEGERDLNGDGDAQDTMLYAFDPLVKRVFPIGIQAKGLMRVVGRTAFIQAYEPDEGVDLNGDGDQLDQVLRVVRIRRRPVVSHR